MNEKAKSLGMIHTTFVDPSGAGAGNVSTAEDLFNLLKHLANNRGFILDLTAGRSEKSAYGAPTFTRLQNFNYFADRKDFVGGKVGSSQTAGETMASVFRLPFGNGEREVAVIVLGSKESGSDTAALVSYVPKTYILAP
jgi:D-alanyl-D-alanine endopeptidase (penicillin-binding protein 7)